MPTQSAEEAWQTLREYASRENSEIYTIASQVPNTISYVEESEAIALVSQHHAASGEPVQIERETFEQIWRQLQNGETLSRPNEPGYKSLAELLDGRYRASGTMGMLDTVFDEIKSDTKPVRVWLGD